jgi:hypothetical protein
VGLRIMGNGEGLSWIRWDEEEWRGMGRGRNWLEIGVVEHWREGRGGDWGSECGRKVLSKPAYRTRYKVMQPQTYWRCKF